MNPPTAPSISANECPPSDPCAAADGMRRGGGGNTAERRRDPQKNLEQHPLGFLGLQPLEIPQNGQRNLRKSLDRNTLVLEKLGELQGGPPLFRHVPSSPRAGLEGELGHMHCPSGYP